MGWALWFLLWQIKREPLNRGLSHLRITQMNPFESCCGQPAPKPHAFSYAQSLPVLDFWPTPCLSVVGLSLPSPCSRSTRDLAGPVCQTAPSAPTSSKPRCHYSFFFVFHCWCEHDTVSLSLPRSWSQSFFFSEFCQGSTFGLDPGRDAHSCELTIKKKKKRMD